MIIGILALQGNYSQHRRSLELLGVENIFVKFPEELRMCDALIIPGGESTTMSKLIDKNNFRNIIYDFSKDKAIFGTCAGMILLSSSPSTKNLFPLNIMKFKIKRNAWGSQTHSFSVNLKLKFNSKSLFNSYFIRAPYIARYDKRLNVLAKYNDVPVLLTDGKHVASSFHPEIGLDTRVHEFFINQINEKV